MQGSIYESNDQSYLLHVLLYWLLEGGAAFVLFQNAKYEKIICRVLIWILCFFVVSYSITFLLSIVFGWNRLQVGEFDYNYFYRAPVFVPLTLTYGSGTAFSIIVYRLLGIARESGIMQCLYSWGFFVSKHFCRHTQKVQVMMLLGILFCMSITGILLFIIIFIINKIFNKNHRHFFCKIVEIVLFSVFGILFLISDSTFGLLYRFQYSFSDRLMAMEYGINNFIHHPLFGIGFFKSHAYIQTEANLVASLGQIGLVGITLFVLIYVIGFFCSTNKRLYLTANASFFLTALTTQPLYLSPLMYIFLFNSYSNKRVGFHDY